MGIAAKPLRGGLAEELAGASRTMILRNGEIERFEDRHGGIFSLWDGFFGRDKRPTTAQVRDLVALGLVGGGMSDAEADRLIEGLGPEYNMQIYTIAQALIGVAFYPDAAGPGGGDEPDGEPAGDTEGKGMPAPGA